MPPMLLRGRPRTDVGYGRHTRPGARPFRYVAAVGQFGGPVTTATTAATQQYGRAKSLFGHTSHVSARKTTSRSRRQRIGERQFPTGPKEKRFFFRGAGGFLFQEKRKPPEHSVAVSKRQVTGRPRPLIAGAKTRSVRGHSPPRPPGAISAIIWRVVSQIHAIHVFFASESARGGRGFCAI